MPSDRYDSSYGSRLVTRILVVLGALVLVAVLTIRQAYKDSLMSMPGYILMGIGAIVLVGGTIWIFRIYFRYRCRECGALLQAGLLANSSKNFPRYYCQSCDIVWMTESPSVEDS